MAGHFLLNLKLIKELTGQLPITSALADAAALVGVAAMEDDVDAVAPELLLYACAQADGSSDDGDHNNDDEVPDDDNSGGACNDHGDGPVHLPDSW